jgi:hypothetical protein
MCGRLFLGVAILTAVISIGCGGGSGMNRDVPAGELAISPPTLNFGTVAVGAKKGQKITLTAGDSSIKVASADWSGEGFSVSGIVFPVTVSAGQSVDFNLTFEPHQAGSSNGNLRLVSDASNSPHAAFRGKGTQAGQHRVNLAWGSTSAVIGYNIYRGKAASGPFTRLNTSPHPASSFTDASVLGGQTYFYVTTAVSKGGGESKYSNRVQVAIPNS